jgi:hypothetical protein
MKKLENGLKVGSIVMATMLSVVQIYFVLHDEDGEILL